MSLRHPNSLAANIDGSDRWIGLVLVLAAVLLVAGWILPLMTVNRLLVLDDQVSILTSTWLLFREGHYFLFAVIAVFSIVFPALKLITAVFVWYRLDLAKPGLSRTLDLIDGLGRWSMLDVFVVALTVVAVEVSLVTDVALHPGLYCFTAAVVLSMIAVRRMTQRARKRAQANL